MTKFSARIGLSSIGTGNTMHCTTVSAGKTSSVFRMPDCTTWWCATFRHISALAGRFQLLTVSPFVARTADDLLLPKEVGARSAEMTFRSTVTTGALITMGVNGRLTAFRR